jgi:hypothetical protein
MCRFDSGSAIASLTDAFCHILTAGVAVRRPEFGTAGCPERALASHRQAVGDSPTGETVCSSGWRAFCNVKRTIIQWT